MFHGYAGKPFVPVSANVANSPVYQNHPPMRFMSHEAAARQKKSFGQHAFHLKKKFR